MTMLNEEYLAIPEHIRKELAQSDSHVDSECLGCGYKGKFPAFGTRNESWLLSWPAISAFSIAWMIPFVWPGILFFVGLSAARHANARKLGKCPDCKTSVTISGNAKFARPV